MPNYAIMSDTSTLARQMLKHGEGMRILVSEASKLLLDKVGGFRCEAQGGLALKVRQSQLTVDNISINIFQSGSSVETFWLVGPDNSD